jgi:TPR repeat protein
MFQSGQGGTPKDAAQAAAHVAKACQLGYEPACAAAHP